jgi:hypothetical protein
MQGRKPDPTTKQKPDSIREISAYYDSHVFRKVYLAGHEKPFSQFLLASNSTQPGQALEAFIHTLFQRTLLPSHTLAPDMQDFDGWLDNLLDKIQPLYIDINLYTRVFTAPDPAKTAAFRVETDFYNDEDPLIVLARAASRGEAVMIGDLENALQEEANQSGYAECLRMGVNLLRRASAFEDATEPPDMKQNTKWRVAVKSSGPPEP